MPLYDPKGNVLQPAGLSTAQLQETIANQDYHLTELKERMAELELAMEDQGWRQLIVGGMREFTRAGLAEIIRMSRLMYLKNPLIKRMVEIQALYVWGRGVTIQGRDPQVNTVIQAFLDDPKNQAELTSHVARRSKEISLQVMGNIFFVFFTNPDTGDVRVRSIPVDEIRQTVFDPEDSKSPWLYRREWTVLTYSDNGTETPVSKREYYPDWGYMPASKPSTMYGLKVNWDTPVYHMKAGGLEDMSMGVPETYAAMDWAKAFKELLEDYCTIKRAHARFAYKMETAGGARGITAAKAKLATTLATGGNQTTIETQPPPVVGSTFVGTDKVKMEAMNTAGKVDGPDDARRVFLMVAAASGWAETFFGDASVGTVATATSLDRPTELKVLDRQTMWAECLRRILDFVVDRNSASGSGVLSGKKLVNKQATDDKVVAIRSDPKSGEEVDRYVEVSFPNVLEHSVLDQVSAIVKAATLGNTQGQLAGTMDLKTVSKMLLMELGAQEIDEILDELFPDGEDVPDGKHRQLPPDPSAKGLPGPDQQTDDPNPGPSIDDDLARSATATERRLMTEAVRELRESLKSFQAKYAKAA